MVVYAPHTLQIRRATEERDSLNRVVGLVASWETIGVCRCDDNTTTELKDDNGHAFVPKYHIVAERLDVKAGDYVRALSGDEVRGEGEVVRVIKTNYLDYMSLYV